ncbi:capsular polysaccharide biosynthesis protein [Gracilibacillus halophilus YIM-C55.5]|uniref:Capsular polysaccharide biosynthesis protein n=1 Tax=Gracilibacillus halophilus YIM-C55.5 TaxID=1308866 RepID=N4WTE7_9BACI|nr:capsular polysaccharide biosynthesis protein [Gracilibacillus halophilus]ENH96431.1 capsular polysaccharide biosynthesis protein [Gracilibacillus halophilus YIM-C55.5]
MKNRQQRNHTSNQWKGIDQSKHKRPHRNLLLVVTAIIIVLSITYVWAKPNDQPLYQASAVLSVGENEEMIEQFTNERSVRRIVEELYAELQVSISTQRLANKIDVERMDQSNLVRISVSDSDPDRAAMMANTAVRLYQTGLFHQDFQFEVVTEAVIEVEELQ